MKTLAIHETQNVAGGVISTELMIVGGGLLAASAIIYALTPSHGCYTTSQAVTKYYDVRTPSYDGYGNYVGDIVDTYSYVDYVPVTIC